jgi:hypothetical protein
MPTAAAAGSATIAGPANPRATASRANGARGRGPVSEAGKRRAAMNAVRHGLFAHGLYIAGGDDGAAWTELHDSLFHEMAPMGVIEASLVNEILMTLWRQRRLSRLEARRLALGDGCHAPVGEPDPPSMTLIIRYRRDLERSLLTLTRELEARQAARGADSDADLACLDQAAAFLDGQPDPEPDPEPLVQSGPPAPPPPANTNRPHEALRPDETAIPDPACRQG